MLGFSSTRSLLLYLALFALSGCSTWEGVRVDPLNRQRVVSASAYSLDGCQSAMDELAHANVKMLQHTRQLAISILSFGYEPSYLCTGTAPLGDSSPAPEIPAHR
jgi:uncharacterized protein YcfL